jgi:hypothetical protein
MPKSNGTIFINYRKDDSNWNALALYNELQKYFDKSRIFKDFNAIQPGDDFVLSIENALSRCDVLLVVMGRQWLNVKNSNSIRRLDDPNDYVRIEIATALERGIQVIPVLFDNTPIPSTQQLPDNLKALSRRQAIEINPNGFEDDVRRLAIAIKKVLGEDETTPPSTNGIHAGENKIVNNPPQAKPDNYLVWAIITTLLCCLPLGIVSILHAGKVDNLYNSGQYEQAKIESAKAKQWAVYAVIAGGIVYVLYFILLALGLNTDYNTRY